MLPLPLIFFACARLRRITYFMEVVDSSAKFPGYLPAYSLDLSPIKPSWAKVKGRLRTVAARTADALHETLGPALDAITAKDAQGYFRHSGHQVAEPNRKPL